MASLRETIASIQDEFEIETGERPSKEVAAVLLDRMADAFCEIAAGAGMEYAICQDRRTAEYLKWQWTGEDGRRLRAALARGD